MTPVIFAAAALAAAASTPTTSLPPSAPAPVLPAAATATPLPMIASPVPAAAPLLPHRHRHRPWYPSPVELRARAANRAATLEPSPAAYINATQVFAWSEGAIYHVLTAPGDVTDIVLQPGEALGSVAAGDTVRWVIGDTSSGTGETKQTHVLVKPFTAGLATNLVIATDRRTYHLALTSTERTALSSLSWTYPADQLIALKVAVDAAQARQPVAAGVAVDALHFGYAISGDQPAWRPLRAFDDGRQTFIEFPADIGVGEAPPLFLVDGKNAASLVNYRVQGRFYVVDRLFDVAELRLGLKHQAIVRITRVGESASRRRGA